MGQVNCLVVYVYFTYTSIYQINYGFKSSHGTFQKDKMRTNTCHLYWTIVLVHHNAKNIARVQ